MTCANYTFSLLLVDLKTKQRSKPLSNWTLCQYGEGIITVSMCRNIDAVNCIFLFSVPLDNLNISDTHCIVLILRVSRNLEIGYKSGLIFIEVLLFRLCDNVIGHVHFIIANKCVSSAMILHSFIVGVETGSVY
jgi:hypothetical protein